MPNLVGIGNSQVPTNAMLGGLAYQDPAHANLTSVEIENIAAIKQKISGTATDIFVYDTRKDSDGGAWRKRTKDTSWYNEAVGVYRGARKEFPAVAVIVVTSSALTIYDADDPNMSMWMVFVNDNSKWLKHTTSGPKSVVAMNGIVVSCGSGGAGRLSAVNFVSDDGYVTEPGYTYRHNWIATRNSTAVGPTDGGTLSIVNISCHAVAMSVLPNAPIDDATGLPIPTIIVGTEGGLSVLKDDGKVFDLSGFNPVNFVAIEKDELVAALGGTSTHDFIFKTNLPSKDEQFDAQIIAGSGNFYMNSSSGTTPLVRDLNMTAMSYNPLDGTVYRGGDNGFDIIAKTTTVSGTSNISLISYVDTDYNTGYMVGDIKNAWLASTDDTDISADTLGSTNTIDGTFSSSDGWTVESDWSIGSGAATCNGNNSGKYLYPSTDRWDIGTILVVQVTVDSVSAGTLSISYSTGGSTSGTSMTSAGTYYHVHEVTGNTLVYLRSDSFQGQIDDVKIYPAEADRSYSNQGLAVVGTITKSAVATGAELVGYSGFSASNYLTYNASSMNFGTGDFSVSVWAIPSTDTTNEFILELDDASQGSNRFYLLVTNTATKKLYVPWDSDIAGSELIAGAWNHIVVGRRSGVGYVYVNGKSIADGTDAWTTSLNGNGRGTIGNYSGGPSADYAWSGSLALLRISGSMPTTEQVKKMYNDEKNLFVTNAKCTLAGATSAITALGFDDTTNILHVGTASGRSEFHGLNRINNTTTAVTTAVSASNGLVAEQ